MFMRSESRLRDIYIYIYIGATEIRAGSIQRISIKYRLPLTSAQVGFLLACMQSLVFLYYIKNQQDENLAFLFISHCKNTLHVSDAFCVHHQELPLQWQPTLDILSGYISSRLMTCTSGCYYSFCTPDDGRRKRPKHVECSCSD